MLLLAWTAAFAILFCGAAIGLLGLLVLLSWVLPEGRARIACQLMLALIGLAIAIVVAF